MAHILSKYLKLWKPQALGIDKISSQKMFIDNIDTMENFAKVTMQKVHSPVQSIDALRAIDTSDTTLFTTGMLIMVYNVGMYSFVRGSSLVDDGNAVIVPTTGGGRWSAIRPTEMTLSSTKIADNAELDTVLTNTLMQMSIGSVKFIIVVGSGNAEYPLYGNAGHITIYKTSDTYSVATMIRYSSNRIASYYTRVRYNDIWGNWVALPYLDENGKIPLSLLPESVLTANALAEAEIITE